MDFKRSDLQLHLGYGETPYKKGRLISQTPCCMINTEVNRIRSPICPQQKTIIKEISILNFGR